MNIWFMHRVSLYKYQDIESFVSQKLDLKEKMNLSKQREFISIELKLQTWLQVNRDII